MREIFLFERSRWKQLRSVFNYLDQLTFHSYVYVRTLVTYLCVYSTNVNITVFAYYKTDRNVLRRAKTQLLKA